MNCIPMLAFSGYSVSGKTTVIEKLVASFKLRNLRVAVIKHDAHQFEIDQDGKDSRRFYLADADVTVISSSEKTALIEKRSLSFEEILKRIHNVDLILIEGYKTLNLPQIGLCRNDTGKPFPSDISRYIAVVTDLDLKTDVPCFGFEDMQELADFIIGRFVPEACGGGSCGETHQ